MQRLLDREHEEKYHDTYVFCVNMKESGNLVKVYEKIAGYVNEAIVYFLSVHMPVSLKWKTIFLYSFLS